MRAILQRVSKASVTVEGQVISSIGPGLLILLGVGHGDGEEQAAFLADKIANLRIFEDEAGKTNLSVLDVKGEAIVVSQFTLYASTRKGNRPSWSRAARGEVSQPLFERFVQKLATAHGQPVPTGVFGADMQVALVNDGPVTIALDSQQPE